MSPTRSADRRSDPAQRARRPSVIVGNVIDFECAAIDVAQHEIGRTRSVNRREPANCHSKPIVLMRAALVMLLLLMS